MSGREMVEQMTHRVVFTREDGHWTVVAPEVHPAHTWGPNLKTASKRIKEAIALVLDLPPGAEKSMSWTLNIGSLVSTTTKCPSSVMLQRPDANSQPPNSGPRTPSE